MYQKRMCFVVNAVFLSTFFSFAQDYDMRKAIIKESMNPKMMLNPENSLPFKPSLGDSPKKSGIDPEKYILLKATYNHRLDSLIRASLINDTVHKDKLSPYLTMPYTNTEGKSYKSEAYKFSTQDWEATSVNSELHKNSAPKAGGSGIGLDFTSKKTMRKRAALKRIKAAYNMK